MRILPTSLFGRLLVLATVSTLAALLVAGFAIGHVLERVVMRGLDDRLDAQVAVLAGAVRPDATLDPARAVALPGFAARGSDWSWQVTSPRGRWASGGVAGEGAGQGVGGARPVDAPPPPPHDGPDRIRADRIRPGEAHDRGGHRLHTRTIVITVPGGPVTIAAAGPRRAVEAPLREAMVPLLVSLALLGGALAAATLVQLRLGLRPLRALQASVAQVIAGDRARIPADQPAELAPLATELNALIDRNAAQLAQARGHVANLAHGLKTPLAALSIRLAARGDDDGSLGAMVADIDARIAHHLRRARAAAPGGRQAATPVAAAVGDLVAVLARIHADRALMVAVDADPALAVAVDPQDLDEMLGNLLDNAWRHAASRLRIVAARDGGGVTIAIEDDGDGLDPAAIAEALVPGRRLDERGAGHGFGLPITRELAELNGGALILDRAAAGGLRAILRLPGARGG